MAENAKPSVATAEYRIDAQPNFPKLDDLILLVDSASIQDAMCDPP